MRRLLIVCLIAFSWAAPTNAASLDPARMTAIDQAADAFLAKAAEARKTGMVPRQTDPAVGPLLDTVFDTRDLTHGPLDYGDVDKLGDWLKRLIAIGDVYATAALKVRDPGLFAGEIGRYQDAAVTVIQAMVDCQMANLDAHPGGTLSPADRDKLDRFRGKIARSFGAMIDVIHIRGVTIGWAEQRLVVVRAAAPSMARFLTPDQLARLRATALRLAASIRDKTLRATFGSVAVALAEPPPPFSPPKEAAPGSGEIALDHDANGYSVPVRINGARTVKFVVDSGASVVALPQDLVDDLTKAGTIAASDLRGRNVYVTADGRKHRGTWLLLRQLDVGGHTVTNVVASVAPAHAEPLLGQTFLAKFKSWTLDNRRHVLVIAE